MRTTTRWTRLLPAVALLATACGKPAPVEEGKAAQSAKEGAPEQPAAEGTVGPAATPSIGVTLVDVTAASGIAWKHSYGDDHLSSILEDTGSGLAWIDFDRDGWLDLYLLSGTHIPGVTAVDPKKEKPVPGRSTLWRNKGDGTFEDVTNRALAGFDGYASGVAVADFDLDGDEDLFLCNYGPNVLLRNQGDGTFEDATAATGLAGPEQLNGFTKWSVSAAFFDADRDGDLDLFVGNYIAFDPSYRSYYLPEGMPGPQSYLGQMALFYRNNGDGTYAEVGEEAGIRIPSTKAMGVSLADYDNDGDLDVYVSNDTTANFLLKNDGTGRFQDVARESGIAYTQAGETSASMHASWGDVNHDGLLDAFIPDLTFGGFFLALDKARFEDRTLASGIAASSGQYSGWGADFGDFDLDGHLDLYVANGKFHHEFPEQDLLFLGDGKGSFRDVTDLAGEWFQIKRLARGAALADYDNDGDLDVAINHNEVEAAPVLLRNDLKEKRHWIEVRVLLANGSPEAIGARVVLEAGGIRQVREVQRIRSFLSSCDPRVHFGLGNLATVDRLTVTWLSGVKTELTDVAADALITVKEGTGRMP
ncbi:MAG: CRTAC1 family protein [Deltaproteobacteria bacterium]|nr:CRTAC1 family protein [Deltaproteobacteria bacterium]